MDKEKQHFMLEMAYELIFKVHHELCLTREGDVADDAQDIMRKLFLLDKKLKGGAE